MVASLLFYCIPFLSLAYFSNEIDRQLIGTWEYKSCTIKNTEMQGTITFIEDGTFLLDAVGHDDCPVPLLKGTYHYQTHASTLSVDYTKGYGLSSFYLVNGDCLYFSNQKISKAKESWDKGYLIANWQYKLVKVKD